MYKVMECLMLTHRFGRKIKLPATTVIKHQIRMLMAQDEIRNTDAQPVEGSVRQLAVEEAEIR